MKKGRHRRYEEARKFKRRSSSLDDLDLDEDPLFGPGDSDEEDPDESDEFADLAAKYNEPEDDEVEVD